MESFLIFFAKRHILTNLIFVGILLWGVYSWFAIGKEAMPNMEFNFVMVDTIYPGSPAEDVEILVTIPIENVIKGISGLESVTSTSSNGRSSIRIRIDDSHPNVNEAVQEIKDAVARAKLPDEAEDPTFRRFRTSERAIIDIGLYIEGLRLLDVSQRERLQQYALSIENKLLGLKEVSSIGRTGYRKPNLFIKVNPDKLLEYNLSVSEVITQVRNHEIRIPGGNLEDLNETEISVILENRTPEDLKKLIVRGGFEGNIVRLGQVAHVEYGFARNKEIRKVQGYEGVILRISKSTSFDILSAREAILNIANEFTNGNEGPIKIILMDDKSYDTRNRLSIIGMNGLIGFILILLILFIFLDFKSGVWVAMGIPFTLCFTLFISHMLGYTVNNITLAAIIIVLGMVVDDAIIVAENVSRERELGLSEFDSAIVGAKNVFLPVIASIATTCAAFVPFIFFSGRFGRFVTHIPLIIYFMLGSSLIESFLILPSHLTLKIRKWFWIVFSLGLFSLFKKIENGYANNKKHWFARIENIYEKFLIKLLRFRLAIIVLFIFLLTISGLLLKYKMKYEMFPREEVNELRLMIEAPPRTGRFETERLLRQVEDLFLKDKGKNVNSLRCSIAVGRRGGAVRENEATCMIELLPKEEREKSTNRLIAQWEKNFSEISGFESLKFARQRFGHDSGSALEILVQENDATIRQEIVKIISAELKAHPALTNVEVEEPLLNPEYKLDLNQDQLVKLGVNPRKVAESIRAFLEGIIAFQFVKGDEEIDVRITSQEDSKENLNHLLNMRVENNGRYLVAIKDIISPRYEKLPNSINRRDFKQAVQLYADLKENSKITPLEVAKFLESTLFKKIARSHPTSNVSFLGEVQDTRESGSNFIFSIIIIFALIYGILALLFNSVFKPFLIIAILPFGVIGVIFAFLLHGMSVYGFFAAVGALGMLGVVVNDSIVLVDKLENEYDKNIEPSIINKIAGITKTRLRAVVLTTLTTIAGLFPTAYGIAGFDSMLAEMMLAMGWGLVFGTCITLILVPTLYCIVKELGQKFFLKTTT